MNPTACANRNTSCPVIPDALCSSDECGCHVAFYAHVNLLGRETRMDVTDICRATAEIKEASEFMEGLLAGEVDKCELVASDPDILFRVFSAPNFLSIGQLRTWILTWSVDVAFNQDRTPAMKKRRQFLASELAALEERIRRRESDGIKNSVISTGNASHASSKEAHKHFQRRKDIIRQWTKRQEPVKILDESVSMYTLITSARTASRKYVVDNHGGIVGSQLPIYGNILYDFVLIRGGIPDDERNNDKKFMLNDPSSAHKIYAELYNQLKNIVLDDHRKTSVKKQQFPLHIASRFCNDSRVRFSFPSLAPQAQKTGLDGNNMMRLMSLAAQTAALGMDLYGSVVGSSPMTLADFVLDWNIADDLTEFLF